MQDSDRSDNWGRVVNTDDVFEINSSSSSSSSSDSDNDSNRIDKRKGRNKVKQVL